MARPCRNSAPHVHFWSSGSRTRWQSTRLPWATPCPATSRASPAPSARCPDPHVAARDELFTAEREEDGGVRKATARGRKRHHKRQREAAEKTGKAEFALALTAAESRLGLFLPDGIDAAQCSSLGC